MLPSAILRAVWYQRKTRHLIETAGFLLVAGACNHHYLRTRENRGAETVGQAQLLSQTQIFAVVSNHFDVLFAAVA